MRCALSLLPLLLLAACNFLGSPGERPQPLPEFTAQLAASLLWQRDIGNGQPRSGRLQPVVHDGILYVATANGVVEAVRTEDGEPLWSARPLSSITGGVSLGAGVVLVAGSVGAVVALAMRDGIPRWQSQLDSAILAPPASGDGLVAISTADGRLYAVATEDGAPLWNYRSRTPLLDLHGHSSPLVLDDAVVAGFSGSRLASLDRSDGTLRWVVRTDNPSGSTPVARLRDIDGQLLLDGDTIYITTYQGGITAVDRNRGRLLWSQPVTALHGPVSALGSLFVVGSDGEISAWDKLSGVVRWRVESLRHRQLSPPSVVSHYLAFCGQAGWCQVLKQSDGSYAARFQHSAGGVSAAPVADGDRLYIYGDSGVLEAWQLVEL